MKLELMVPCVVLLCIWLLCTMYVRLRYPFWCVQPVYHAYSWRWVWTPHVIEPEWKPRSKFLTLHHRIVTRIPTSQDIQYLRSFLTLYYAPDSYAPTEEHCTTTFQHHSEPCWISWIYNNSFFSGGSRFSELQGVLTSRPLCCNESMWVYYVDHLCVHPSARGKQLAAHLIQTHEARQRHHVPHMPVSLFKREHELLSSVVPLCQCTSALYSTRHWLPTTSLPDTIRWLSLTHEHMYELHTFVHHRIPELQVRIVPHVQQWCLLAQQQQWRVFALLTEDALCAAYFFRVSGIRYKEENEVYTCVASVYDTTCISVDVFLHGFLQSACSLHTHYVWIDGMAHNTEVLARLPTLVEHSSNTAYYWYNYRQPTVRAAQALILS